MVDGAGISTFLGAFSVLGTPLIWTRPDIVVLTAIDRFSLGKMAPGCGATETRFEALALIVSGCEYTRYGCKAVDSSGVATVETCGSVGCVSLAAGAPNLRVILVDC